MTTLRMGELTDPWGPSGWEQKGVVVSLPRTRLKSAPDLPTGSPTGLAFGRAGTAASEAQ